MQTITIIIGLPGSGKTTYIKNNSEKFRNAVICDDYDKSTDARKHSHDFKSSIYYQDLKNALLNNKDVVLTDISWCRKEMREALKDNLEKMLKEFKINAQINFIYFENNPEACKKNILKRNREDRTEREIELIDRLSSLYVIPDKFIPILITV